MKTILTLFGILIFLTACTPTTEINSFMDCVNAGNPVMESYPRQCSANGETFVEEIALPVEATECPEPRPTVATKEYRPVEGSDGVVYDNWRVACIETTVAWYKPVVELEVEFHECSETEKAAEICTMDYNPVCGMIENGILCITTPCPSNDAVTYSNGCSACSAKAMGYYPGACEDNTFVVCGENEKGFDPVEYAKNINGICVDVCPGNYDSFMTQIGVEQCILRYGEEEISEWEVCSQSSDKCECVKAVETTGGEQIEDAQYRCVPEEYANRMLFRSGVDRLDENGKQSVMIA